MNWYKRQFKIAASHRGWTQEELGKIEGMLNEGYSARQISKIFGVSSHTINYIVNKYQLIDRSNEELDREEIEMQIYDLYKDGVSIRGISDIVNLSPATVGRIVKKKEISRSKSDMKTELGIQQGLYKQRFIDNPQIRENISNGVKQYWSDIGGLEGRLLSYSSRNEAYRYLMRFVKYVEMEGDRQKAFAIWTVYKKIIDNHTFPDEVQQTQQVAS